MQATAERVELTVAVVREDGTPFEGASVGSYSFMSSKSHTDASGHATIPGWQGMHMTVYAAEQGYPPFTHQTVVAAAGKTVSFVLEQRSLTEAIGTVIYVLWSEDVPTGLEDLNLLEDALEQPDLSTEAREQIQDWIVDANESVDDTFDLMDLFDEILGLDF